GVGRAAKRREQHEYDPEADRGGRRGALARKIEHQRDDVRADRYVGDRRVEWMAEPHAVQQIFDRRHRLVERGEDRDEELTERIGPYGLRIEDPLDDPVQHARSLRTSSERRWSLRPPRS